MELQRSSVHASGSGSTSTLNPPFFRISISRSERWQVQHRLTELGITSTCPQDGCLAVDIANPVALIQLRSLLQQIAAPRQQLLAWLEQCWEAS